MSVRKIGYYLTIKELQNKRIAYSSPQSLSNSICALNNLYKHLIQPHAFGPRRASAFPPPNLYKTPTLPSPQFQPRTKLKPGPDYTRKMAPSDRLNQVNKHLNYPAGMLAGQVAIITGAGQGIGAEAARLFANEGAKVIVADIDASTSILSFGLVFSAYVWRIDCLTPSRKGQCRCGRYQCRSVGPCARCCR